MHSIEKFVLIVVCFFVFTMGAIGIIYELQNTKRMQLCVTAGNQYIKGTCVYKMPQ